MWFGTDVSLSSQVKTPADIGYRDTLALQTLELRIKIKRLVLDIGIAINI